MILGFSLASLKAWKRPAACALLVMNLIPALYIGLIHQRGTLDVMSHLRQLCDITDPQPEVLFLMPCHSTPFYRYPAAFLSWKQFQALAFTSRKQAKTQPLEADSTRGCVLKRVTWYSQRKRALRCQTSQQRPRKRSPSSRTSSRSVFHSSGTGADSPPQGHAEYAQTSTGVRGPNEHGRTWPQPRMFRESMDLRMYYLIIIYLWHHDYSG